MKQELPLVTPAGLCPGNGSLEWQTTGGGCRLESLELVEADPAPLQRLLDAVGYKARVRAGERSMRLELQCPKGRVTFTL